MSQESDSKRRSRLRWITLGEAVAIVAVVISGIGLWQSYQDRSQERAEKARATSPAPFYLRATADADGSTLTLAPVVADHAIQGQAIRFPPAFKLAPVTTTSDARIEAGWFGDALKADRKTHQLPDETQGDERVPVMIETDYLAGGQPLQARAYYDIGYALEGHFLRGSSVKLRGLSLIGKASGADTAIDRHLGALWDARAGKPKP
ncbi:MAG TPA: hypothetical protein VGC28_09080 [Sphingomonas sp.]